VPTGIAIRDVRTQLFDAAERILLRDGAAALTSRAVTTEAGCAKGVLHRHFADFDEFLAELVRDRAACIQARGATLHEAAGTGDVAGNLTGFLLDLFGTVALGILQLIIARDELRARLRATTPAGLPILSDAATSLTGYLAAERDLGRLPAGADVDAIALLLIGTAHLVFAGRDGVAPDDDEVRRFVAAAIPGT
jgi:AcrR family transcriptional regulator